MGDLHAVVELADRRLVMEVSVDAILSHARSLCYFSRSRGRARASRLGDLSANSGSGANARHDQDRASRLVWRSLEAISRPCVYATFSSLILRPQLSPSDGGRSPKICVQKFCFLLVLHLRPHPIRDSVIVLLSPTGSFPRV